MQVIPLLLLITVVVSCQVETPAGLHKKSPATVPVVVKVRQDSRIDIDSVLSVQNNGLFADHQGRTLSLCCYDLLDVSSSIHLDEFRKTTEEYYDEKGMKLVNVYSLGNSFVKTFFNNDPAVQRTDIVFGRIKNIEVELENEISIGMPKDDLLQRLFRKSDLFDRIDTLSISENEIGDAFTLYVFRNGKLSEIVFDSSYDWITKDVFREVAISDLLNKPTKYQDKTVIVSGYLHLNFEEAAIYADEKVAKERTFESGFWVDFSRELVAKRDVKAFKNTYVTLAGTFNARRKGHLGMFAGTIEDIVKLESRK